MRDWHGVDADLAITDPPFGIDFSSNKSNYRRDSDHVVNGYVEWSDNEYESRVTELCDVLADNTVVDGQCLIFSGWNNSDVIHRSLEEHDAWTLEGKLYWDYNFAPYCTRRPAHNVYEIFWAVKSDDWFYDNECPYEHCTEGEANLSVISVDRNYIQEREKYPTRLPPKIVEVVVEHFSRAGDLLFDPLAGSGTVGLVGERLGMEYVLGDSNRNARRVFEKSMERLDVGENSVVAD